MRCSALVMVCAACAACSWLSMVWRSSAARVSSSCVGVIRMCVQGWYFVVHDHHTHLTLHCLQLLRTCVVLCFKLLHGRVGVAQLRRQLHLVCAQCLAFSSDLVLCCAGVCFLGGWVPTHNTSKCGITWSSSACASARALCSRAMSCSLLASCTCCASKSSCCSRV